MVWFEGAGLADSARRYLYADERGSIVAITDANGNALAINAYDEYGIPAAANQGRFQYTGQAWLPDLGLYYYKARMYSPTLGRFMQTDPIGYEDQFNLYGYVGNDPVNHHDFDGKECRLTGREVRCIVKLEKRFSEYTKFEQSQLRRLVSNYAIAAARAQASAERGGSVIVPARNDKPSFRVPAAQVRDNLFTRPVFYRNAYSSGDSAHHSLFKGMEFNRNNFHVRNAVQQQTFLHEGIHHTTAEHNATQSFGAAVGVSKDHAAAYNAAARQFPSYGPSTTGLGANGTRREIEDD